MRNRVRELRHVRAADIHGAPWNWRTHGTEQRQAVLGSLTELGLTEPLKVRELDDGRLQLWDGHLRLDLFHGVDPEMLVPVIVTDLNEEEAKKAILIHDPLAAMAGEDTDKLAALLAEVSVSNGDLETMLDAMRSRTAEAEIEQMAAAGPVAVSEEPAVVVPIEEGFKSLTVPLTVKQEIEVRQGIRMAKAKFSCQSSGEALYQIVREWVEAQEKSS